MAVVTAPRSRRNTLIGVLFALHLLVLHIAVFSSPPSPDATMDRMEGDELSSKLIAAVLLSAFGGVFWSYNLIQITATGGVDRIFELSHRLSAIFFGLNILILMYFGVWSLVVALSLLVVGDALWMHRQRSGDAISFVAETLKLCRQCLIANPTVLRVVVGAMVVQVVYLLIWANSLVHALSLSPASATAAIVFLFISLRWTLGTLKHTVTFVVSSTTYAWLNAQAAAVRNASGGAIGGSSATGVGAGNSMGVYYFNYQNSNSNTTHGGDGGASDTTGVMLDEDDDERDTARLAASNAIGRNGSTIGGGGGGGQDGFPVRRGGFDDDDVLDTIALEDDLDDTVSSTASATTTRGGKSNTTTTTINGMTSASGAAGAAGGRSHTPRSGRAGGITDDSDVSVLQVNDHDQTVDQDGNVAPSAANNSNAGTAPPTNLAPIAAGASTADILKITRGAVTKHLGSIATGSFLGFVSPLAWAVRRGARAVVVRGRTFPDSGRRHKTLRTRLATLGALIFRWADAYLQISHKYSYVSVAMQNQGWFTAAKLVWNQFNRSGTDAVIEGDCTDRLLLFGSYLGGSVLSLMLGTTVRTPGVNTWLLCAISVFWLGFVGVALPLTVLEAFQSTLFVVFAQSPETLQLCHPILMHRYSRLAELRLLRRKHEPNASRMAVTAAGGGAGFVASHLNSSSSSSNNGSSTGGGNDGNNRSNTAGNAAAVDDRAANEYSSSSMWIQDDE